MGTYEDMLDTTPEEQVTDGLFMALMATTELKSHFLGAIVEDLIKDNEMDKESVKRCKEEATRQYDFYVKSSTEGSEFRANLMYRMMRVEQYLEGAEDEG